MDENGVFSLFNATGAVASGHFIYASGKHGCVYVDKYAIYPHVRALSSLCRAIAEQCCDERISVVIGPERGGIVVSQWTAYHMGDLLGREVLSVYADKNELVLADPGSEPMNVRGRERFSLSCEYKRLIKGRHALAVEDVLTTGTSVRKVVDEARKAGGIVLGVGAIWNRGGVTHEGLGVDALFSLANRRLDDWDPAECPLCARKIPITPKPREIRDFPST
jgi:orotate phosphoribosyltransferase